ncbi:MAG: hypothetical protein ABIG44_03225 [Planctomycetota bacterium]
MSVRAYQWLTRGGGVVGLVLVPLLVITGCARQGEMVLHQPFAAPSQKHMQLTGNWTYEASASERRTCLLAFPLPHMVDGPRDFMFYLSMPGGDGEFAVATGAAGGADGFFIQAVGDLQGKATFTAGTVAVRGVWYKRGVRRLDLALQCDDGSEIEGRVYLRTGPDEIRTFERRHAADIALLHPTASQPADGGEVTDSRLSGRPDRLKTGPTE